MNNYNTNKENLIIDKRNGWLTASSVVDRRNIFILREVAAKVLSQGARVIDLHIPDNGNISLPKIAREISKLRSHFLGQLLIRAGNLPYCLLKRPEGTVYFDGSAAFHKPDICSLCKYGARCGGVLKNYYPKTKGALRPVKDLPREVMIELEPRCNLRCGTCFNRYSFARHGRSIPHVLTSDVVKKIIDSIVTAGIPMVRFTGGEPLLRKDIFDLAAYAKARNLEVRLNTNGVLIHRLKLVHKTIQFFDNILLSMRYADVNGSKIGKEKIKAIRLLKRGGMKVIRVGTVATPEVVDNFDQVSRFISHLPVDKWELYRPIGALFNALSIKKLIKKLLKIQQQTNKTSYLVNAVPFCIDDPIKVQSVVLGADAVDGHERLVVDPRGFAKPIYYIDENIGDPRDILSCWAHPFMQKVRNLEMVPQQCKACLLVEKCRGGCRFSSLTGGGHYNALDPLANLKNRIH